jgi:hypothetical protein
MALSTDDKARIHEEAREWTIATRQIRRDRTPNLLAISALWALVLSLLAVFANR